MLAKLIVTKVKKIVLKDLIYFNMLKKIAKLIRESKGKSIKNLVI